MSGHPMNSLLRWSLFTALCATPVLAASVRMERTLDKSFSVTQPGTLRVETQGGEIRVTPSTDGTVKVTARQRIRAANDGEAEEVLQDLQLTMAQEGRDVFLRAKYDRPQVRSFFRARPSVQVDFYITAPVGFAADLATSGGSITVVELDREVRARTSGGSVKLGRVGGPADVRTSGGSITLDEAGGPVDLRTSGGSITVGEVSGAAELSTSGGSIRIDSVAGAVRASTSGGSIRAGIAGPLKEECVLSTSGGGVRVTVDKAAAFQLDASSSGGVSADGITLTVNGGKLGRDRLAGAVNGGGPLLKLRTSGGGIAVAAR